MSDYIWELRYPIGNCAECGEECSGTVGTISGESLDLCEFCYKHIAQLRPILKQVDKDEARRQIKFLIEQDQSPRVKKGILAYLEVLSR